MPPINLFSELNLRPRSRRLKVSNELSPRAILPSRYVRQGLSIQQTRHKPFKQHDLLILGVQPRKTTSETAPQESVSYNLLRVRIGEVNFLRQGGKLVENELHCSERAS